MPFCRFVFGGDSVPLLKFRLQKEDRVILTSLINAGPRLVSKRDAADFADAVLAILANGVKVALHGLPRASHLATDSLPALGFALGRLSSVPQPLWPCGVLFAFSSGETFPFYINYPNMCPAG